MNGRERLVLRNGVLLGRMRTLAKKAAVTNGDHVVFNSLCRDFDENVAKIDRMDALSRFKGLTQQHKRRMATAKREKQAARRMTAITAIDGRQGRTDRVCSYEEVPVWSVDSKKREAADRMLKFCKIDLNLSSKLKVRWCNEHEPGNPEKPRLFSEKTSLLSTYPIATGCIFKRGQVVLDDTIWLNHEIKPEVVPRTVAHECRHVYQALHEKTLQEHGKKADEELDAIEYSKQALNAFRFTDHRPGRGYDTTRKSILTR